MEVHVSMNDSNSLNISIDIQKSIWINERININFMIILSIKCFMKCLGNIHVSNFNIIRKYFFLMITSWWRAISNTKFKVIKKYKWMWVMFIGI